MSNQSNRPLCPICHYPLEEASPYVYGFDSGMLCTNQFCKALILPPGMTIEEYEGEAQDG